MRYIINTKEKTLMIVGTSNIDDIKYLMKTFKGYRIIPKISNNNSK